MQSTLLVKNGLGFNLQNRKRGTCLSLVANSFQLGSGRCAEEMSKTSEAALKTTRRPCGLEVAASQEQV